MSVPVGRDPQHMQALTLANEIRIERARLVGGLGRGGSGKISKDRMAELILDPPDALLGMQIDRLLARVGRFRWMRVEALLERERITSTRLVRELTERQRQVIAERLVGR